MCSKLVSSRLDKRISRSKGENFVGRFLVALVCRKKVEEFCFVLFWIFLVCEEVYEISLTLIVGVVVSHLCWKIFGRFWK